MTTQQTFPSATVNQQAEADLLIFDVRVATGLILENAHNPGRYELADRCEAIVRRIRNAEWF